MVESQSSNYQNRHIPSQCNDWSVSAGLAHCLNSSSSQLYVVNPFSTHPHFSFMFLAHESQLIEAMVLTGPWNFFPCDFVLGLRLHLQGHPYVLYASPVMFLINALYYLWMIRVFNWSNSYCTFFAETNNEIIKQNYSPNPPWTKSTI